MKFYTTLFLLFLYGIPAQSQEKKCLLILLDGIPADVLEKTNTPNIDKVIKVGDYSRAYVGGQAGGITESPTISAVGYNSMLTGTWANKHNVYSNGIKNPNYQYPSIFSLAKKHHPEWTLGIYSTWEDNRTKLLGEGLEGTQFLKLDYVSDGYEKDTLAFPHDAQKKYLNRIDQKVTKEAAQSIKKDAPTLSWVYLEYTDAIGHQFGHNLAFNKAIKIADKQVGLLHKAIQYRAKHFNEEWLLIITTDHGRDKETGKNHGGQSESERTTWVAGNQPNTNAHFKNGLAIVDIFPSVAQFLGLPIDKHALDGVSFLE
jgi:predicted AlkP superfamily pyrophosphatase or phosphodiesterase